MSSRSSPVIRVTPFELWTLNTWPFGAANTFVSLVSARSAQGMPGRRLRSSALRPCPISSSRSWSRPQLILMAFARLRLDAPNLRCPCASVVAAVALAPLRLPLFVLHGPELLAHPPPSNSMPDPRQRDVRARVARAVQVEPAHGGAGEVPDVAHVAGVEHD